jgi:hypothetical protein
MSVTVPRWLELEQEIGFLYFLLDHERKSLPRSPIDKLIDATTGTDVARLKHCQEIAIQLKTLKAEWSRETGEEVSTEMEDAILAIAQEPTP